MTTNRIATTVVQYAVNQSSVAAVQAANQQIVASMQSIPAATSEVVTATGTLNAAFERIATNQAFTKLAEQAAAGAISFDEMAQAAANLGATEPELNKLAQDITNIQNAQTDAGGIGVGGLRSGLRAGGFLLGSEAGGGSLRAAGQIITLGTAFGGVGVAAGALILTMRGLESEMEGVKQATDAALSAQKTYYDAVRQLSSNQAQAEINNLQKINTGLQQQIDETQSALTRAFQDAQDKFSLGGGSQGVSVAGDFFARVATALAGSGLQDRLTELQKEFGVNADVIARLTQGLQANAFAANDAADAAQRQHAMAQNQFTDDQLRQKVDQEDAAQRQQRIAELRREIEINRADAAIHSDNADTVKLLGDEYLRLTRELEFTSEVTDTWADKLDALAQRSTAVDNLFDALTKEGEAEQKVAQAQQDVAQAARDHADQIRQIQQDEQDKEAQDRQKAAQQAEDDQAKHLQRLADIDAQYNADHEAAVGNRDALANYQAQQKRQDDTQKENANYALQEQQLQQHLDQQLQQERAAEQRQEQSEDASYARRNAQLIQALNNAQVEESRAAGLALAYQRQANDAELNQRIQANYNMTVVDETANNAQIDAEVQKQQAILSAVYYGSSSVETAFVNLMGSLTQIVQNSIPTPYGINNNGGNYLIGGGGTFNPFAGAQAGGNNINPFAGAHAYINQVVDQRVAAIVQEANR